MLEISLIIIGTVIGANLLMRWREYNDRLDTQMPHLRTISTIAKVGNYQWDKPTETSPAQAFKNLHLIEGGLSLGHAQGALDWLFSDIQAQSAVMMGTDGLAVIQLHIQREGIWRVLTLSILPADMAVLVNVLRRYRANVHYFNGQDGVVVTAKLADQNWKGEVTLGAEVVLLLVGRLLVILQDDHVQAKLALSSLKRVIALARKDNADGLIRLHSTTESALFTLKNYAQFAQVLAERANCPLELVTIDDKKEKG